MRAVSGLAPALEFLELPEEELDLEETLAANTFHRRVVLGSERKPTTWLDMRCVDLSLSIGNRAGIRLDSRLVVGEVPSIVRFVASTLEVLGEGLQAGDRIICGSLNPTTVVEPGVRVVAEVPPAGRIDLDLTAA